MWKWIKNLFKKKKSKGQNSGKDVCLYGFGLPDETTTAGKLVAEAMSQVGQLYETSKNWSPNLKAYLAKTSFTRGLPWCQYFQNAVGIKVMGYYWAHGRGGGTQATWRRAKRKGLTRINPQPGYMIVWQNLSDENHGHVGMVVAIKNDTEIYTVEGNSGNKTKCLLRSSIKGHSGKRLLGYIAYE